MTSSREGLLADPGPGQWPRGGHEAIGRASESDQFAGGEDGGLLGIVGDDGNGFREPVRRMVQEDGRDAFQSRGVIGVQDARAVNDAALGLPEVQHLAEGLRGVGTDQHLDLPGPRLRKAQEALQLPPPGLGTLV